MFDLFLNDNTMQRVDAFDTSPNALWFGCEQELDGVVGVRLTISRMPGEPGETRLKNDPSVPGRRLARSRAYGCHDADNRSFNEAGTF